MTKMIYCSTIEELVQLLIERELYGSHKDCIIKFDDRKRISKIIDAINSKHDRF